MINDEELREIKKGNIVYPDADIIYGKKLYEEIEKILPDYKLTSDMNNVHDPLLDFYFNVLEIEEIEKKKFLSKERIKIIKNKKSYLITRLSKSYKANWKDESKIIIYPDSLRDPLSRIIENLNQITGRNYKIQFKHNGYDGPELIPKNQEGLLGRTSKKLNPKSKSLEEKTEIIDVWDVDIPTIENKILERN